MPIVFSTKEVLMLFSKEFPTALSNLDRLISDIQGRSSAFKSKAHRERALYPEEHGLYFTNERGEQVLWFGVWMDFWKEGVPLCFGVDDKWPAAVAEAFRDSYKGPTKRFKHWTLGWVSQQAFASEKAVEEVWKLLAPVLEAVARAGV
jgi:hypothetical protein